MSPAALLTRLQLDTIMPHADADAGDITGCTKVINGGRNGLPDRFKYWDRARTVLGVDMTTTRGAA